MRQMKKQLLIVIDGKGSKAPLHHQVAQEGLPEVNGSIVTKIMVGAGLESVLMTNAFEAHQEKKGIHYPYLGSDGRLAINGHTPSGHEIMAAIDEAFKHCSENEICLTAVPPEIGQTIWNRITGKREELLPLEVIQVGIDLKGKMVAAKA